MKKTLNQIKVISIICAISLCFFEAFVLISFRYPDIWLLSPNKFFPQKLYRSERNIIQFMDECAVYDNKLAYQNRIGHCEFSNYEFETDIFISYRYGRIPSTREGQEKKNCRLIFIGDSHTFGWGVEQDETFSELTGDAIGCQVYNLGVSSYGTARAIIDLNDRNLFAGDSMNHVFLQYSDNDFRENESFKINNGKLPVINEDVYEKTKNKYKERKKYFPLKYTLVVVKRASQKLALWLSTAVSCHSDCSDRVTGSDHKISELEAFEYALTKLQVSSKITSLTIFQINGSNRGKCDLIDQLKKSNSFYYGAKSFLKINILQICEEFVDDDFFILDDHINKRGHQKVSAILVKNFKKEKYQ